MSEQDFDEQPDFEMDGTVGYLVYNCQSCGRNRHEAASLVPGTKVRCRCGKTAVTVAGDGLDSLQRDFDDLNRIFESFGGLKKGQE